MIMTPYSPEEKEDLFFRFAENQALMAKCPRKHVGCVIVLSKEMILTAGFNRSAFGLPTCEDVGCLIEGGHCVRSMHAEQMAIAWAAKRGIRLDGTEAYLTLLPCVNCFQSLYMSGIKVIHFDESYEREEREHVHQLARSAGVALIERNRS